MVRRRLGWPLTDSFVSNDELTDMLKESKRELLDFLISVHGGDFRGTFAPLLTVADQSIYVISTDTTLASTIDLPIDVARIHRVSLVVNNRCIPMRRWDVDTQVFRTDSVAWDESTDIRYKITYQERGMYLWFNPTPAGVYTVELYVIPGSDALTFSATTAINDIGHDEYLVLDCAAKCAEMEETDSTPFVARRERYKEMLTNNRTPIDQGQAETIQDVRGLDFDTSIDRWRRW